MVRAARVFDPAAPLPGCLRRVKQSFQTLGRPSQGRADQDVRLDSGLESPWGHVLTPTPHLTTFSAFRFFTEEITKVPLSTSSPGAPRDLAKTLKNARFF